MHTVRQWLEELGLPQHAEVFERNAIDPDLLCELTDEDLENLGVHALGHRKRLLRAIAELNGGKASAPSAFPIQASLSTRERESTSTEGERRQLTVLFCDMVGFTELANRVDPEVLQRIIRSYEDACAVCITRYEGYVFQRLGDGIVAFFGYPLAHEGEAERAIHAGLEIIAALSKLDVPDAGHLAVRIGIATGLVVVSSAEKGAVGETMNLASRLQAIAPPGSIVVSERVHRLASGSFEYQDLGKQALKGIAQPTHAYRIVGVSEAASRFEAATQEGLTPLVGRVQEIGLLLERWALAQDGEGQVVLLSGEPGIGKSRILSALRERLEAQGAQALRYQCSPYHINSAFWPSIDNFERALKFGRDELPESKLDKLEALIVTRYGRPLGDVRFVASLLSIPYEERYGTISISPQKHKDETLRTLVDLTDAAARKQPSVMLFEDAHWADPTSLEVLDLLVDRVRTIPLLIVLTHRPEFQSRWSQHGHVTALNLSKLTRAQSGAIVSKLAGVKALPADLLEQIIAKTDGVPLFVEELTKSILESGELQAEGDHYEYAGSSHDITIPSTLRDSLMARLDRFAPIKDISQIGAVIGREFSYELIAAVAPMPQSQLDVALTQLTDSGLAFRRGTPPDAVYTFKHALVQDVAYDSLLKSKRSQLHKAIAAALESAEQNLRTSDPALLARHLTAAGEAADAVPLWIAAQKQSFARFAIAEAEETGRIALDQLEKAPSSIDRVVHEIEIQMTLGNTLVMSRGYAAQEVSAAFDRAAKLCGQDLPLEERMPVLAGAYLPPHLRGEHERSLELAYEMMSLAGKSGKDELNLIAHSLMMVSYFWLGDQVEAREQYERAMALYDPEHHRALTQLYVQEFGITDLTYASHFLWMLGFPDQALAACDKKDAYAFEMENPFMQTFSLTFGAACYYYCGYYDAHWRKVEQGRKIAENLGNPLFAASGLTWGGGNLIRRDQADAGVTRVREGIEAWRSIGTGLWVPYYRTMLAEGLAATGKLDDALSEVDQALKILSASHERSHEAEVYRVRGSILGALSRKPEAEEALESAIAVARRQRTRSWELRAATALAQLWQSQGKHRQAFDLLAPVYDWFTEGFGTRDLRNAKAVLDELS